MIKRDEISDPTSCLNRALEDEPLFVLTGPRTSGASALSWRGSRFGSRWARTIPATPRSLKAQQWCDKDVEWRQGKTGTTS